MIEALHYDFMQYALIAGVLVSLIAGIVGSLVVVNRMVFLAGGIAHASYGGIGLAVYFSLPIFLGASLFAVAAAVVIAQLSLRRKERLDTYIGLVWAVGMALGVLLIDLTPGYHIGLTNYLFGSILAVEKNDLWLMAMLLAIVVSIVLFRYRNILAVSYDSNFAALQGLNVPFYYTLMLILASLSVVVAIKVVGLILVIALLSIPVYVAETFAVSLWQMMLYAAAFSVLFTLTGLLLAFGFDISSGAAIVLVSAFGMLAVSGVRHFITKR